MWNQEVETKRTPNYCLILDGMAVVHEISSIHVSNCKDFSREFIKVVNSRMKQYDQVHIIFDHYDVHKSVKEVTRNQRTGTKKGQQHFVCQDSTPVRGSFKEFIMSVKTKESLTHYLQEKMLQACRNSPMHVIVSTSKGALSNRVNVDHLTSTHEEADSILILHALHVARDGAQVDIMSPDTDVFVIALSHAPHLGRNPSVILGTGLQ